MSSIWAEICHYSCLITGNITVDGNQHPISRILPVLPCSKCIMPQESHNTDTCQLVFQAVPTRKERLKWGMLTARNSDWLEGLLMCGATNKAVRILTHISWSCPTREIAVIENMGISIHMWGEQWYMRSVAGADGEKQSAQQPEVAVRQTKF